MSKLTCIDGEHTLDGGDLKELYAAIPDGGEGAYTYESGYYEGNGCFVVRLGDKLDITGMSHCSCYGPTDSIALTRESDMKSIEEVRASPAYNDPYDDTAKRVVDFLFPL